MDLTKRQRTIQAQDQENVHVSRGKANVLPAKKQVATVRDALGDVNANIQAQRVINTIGKFAEPTAEFDKKAALGRSKSTYNHVQAKVDTRLPGKNISQPSTRLPLRHAESTTGHAESTTGHAVKATLQTRAAVKETAKSTVKDTGAIPKKADPKKITTRTKEKIVTNAAIKRILKEEATESLGKPKIDDPTSLINQTTPPQASLQCNTNKPLLKESNSIMTMAIVKKNQTNLVTSELPANVENIDARDSDPLMPMTYVEENQSTPKQMGNQSFITPQMRTVVMDHLLKGHHKLKHELDLLVTFLETFDMTMDIVDRYLQVTSNVQRNQLRLIGVTAVFISCKFDEVNPPDIECFVRMINRAYSNEEIIRCEQDITEKLTFYFVRPTQLSFLRRFATDTHATSESHHLAKYFVDLCLIDYSMAHYQSIKLSAAAVCLSLYLLSSCRNLEDVWTPELVNYSTHKFDSIKPTMRKIAQIVADVDNLKYESVYQKYQDVKLSKVSTLPQLKSETMSKLINSMS